MLCIKTLYSFQGVKSQKKKKKGNKLKKPQTRKEIDLFRLLQQEGPPNVKINVSSGVCTLDFYREE